MYEIVGETIKSATSIKLGQIFDNIKRYKENITKPGYPNFHIVQVSLNGTPRGLTNRNSVTNVRVQRIQLDYIINVQYRVAENTETVTNLQQQLDDIGLRLCAWFNELDLELPTKVYNKNYDKYDGVGQFTFNIRVFATPEDIERIKMQELELNEEVKEEN